MPPDRLAAGMTAAAALFALSLLNGCGPRSAARPVTVQAPGGPVQARREPQTVRGGAPAEPGERTTANHGGRNARSESAAAAPKRALDQIGKVNGRGWYLPMYRKDPAHPNGPPLPVLIAEAQTGEIMRHGGNPDIVMHTVKAKLYRQGVHAADVVAATVRASQNDQRVVGTGGCTVTSLLNPADTVLTADKITWDTANTRFVAEGHAKIVRRPTDGSAPITQEGGKIAYDMDKNLVTVL